MDRIARIAKRVSAAWCMRTAEEDANKIPEEADPTGLIEDAEIEKALKDFHINDYGEFKKIHDDEWICSPINRNADIPDIYIRQENDKIVCGYYFANDDDDANDYKGTPQDAVTGLMIELAKIKNDVESFVVEARNDAQNRMDQQAAEEAAASPEEGDDEESDDDDLDLGDDDDEDDDDTDLG